MNRKIELKRCPFCGGEAITIVKEDLGLVCLSCGLLKPCQLHYYGDKEEAIKAWNRRVKDE